MSILGNLFGGFGSFNDAVKQLSNTLIPTSMKMALIRKFVADELGYEVKTFELHVNLMDETINIIPNCVGAPVPLKNEKAKALMGAAKSYLSDNLQSGDRMDFITLTHEKDRTYIKIYYTDPKGEKLTLTENL